MNVRPSVSADAPRLCEIYYRSVHEVARAKYDAAQLEAWAPEIPDPDRFRERFRDYVAFVADRDGSTVGWIAMSRTGYVDMLFCLPEATRCGIADELYRAAEREARSLGLTTLTAHASLLAQSFFHKHGWTICNHETVDRSGVEIPRAFMSKHLKSG